MVVLSHLRKLYLYLEALFYDERTIDKNIPRPQYFTHEKGIDWMLDKFDFDGSTILEIGSKEVVGKSLLKKKLKKPNILALIYKKVKM